MIIRSLTGDGRTVKVSFVLTDLALQGQSVSVVGDFNDWDPAATPMDQHEDGKLVATIGMQPGWYRFRYLSEAGWFNDPMADAYEANESGGKDGILDLTAEPGLD